MKLLVLGLASVLAGPGEDFLMVNNAEPFTCTSIVKWFQDLECCDEANAAKSVRPTLGNLATGIDFSCPGVDFVINEDPIRMSEFFGQDILAWKNTSAMVEKEIYEQTLLPLQSHMPDWKAKCEEDGFVADGQYVESITRECFLFGMTRDLIDNMNFWTYEAPQFINEAWWGGVWYSNTKNLLKDLGSVIFFKNNPTVPWSFSFVIEGGFVDDVGRRLAERDASKTRPPAAFLSRVPKRKRVAHKGQPESRRKLGPAPGSELEAALTKEYAAKWSNVLSQTKAVTFESWRFRDLHSLENAMPFLARYVYYAKVLVHSGYGMELSLPFEPEFITSETVVVPPEGLPDEPGTRPTVLALHHPALTESDTARLWSWQTDINSPTHNCTFVTPDGNVLTRNGCTTTECACDLDLYDPSFNERRSQSRKIYKDGLLWFIFDINVFEAGSFNFILSARDQQVWTGDVRMASPLIEKIPEKNPFVEIPQSQQVFVKFTSELNVQKLNDNLPGWTFGEFNTAC